jgi:hypothetical protein
VELLAADLIRAWVPLLESRLGFRFEMGQLDETEIQWAERFRDEKFGNAGWSRRR